MEFISETYFSQNHIRRFSAPSGYLYKIWGFHITNYGTSGTEFVITNRYVEEEDFIIEREANSMIMMSLAISGSHTRLVLPDPIETKYISMGLSNDVLVNVTVHIYYTLKKATIPELVWEFIKRGKSP